MLVWPARIDRAVGAILRPVVFAGVAALTAVITLQIVSRVFFTSVGWTEEVARFLLIWISFLGAALAFQQGRHICVSVLRSALPDRARRVVTVLALLCSIAFLLALAKIGFDYMLVQSFQKSPSLRVSMTYIYAVMPISAAIAALLCLTDLAQVLAGEKPRDERDHPIEEGAA